MRTRTEFVCRECGYRAPRALGRCPECETWGSLEPATATAPIVSRPPNGIGARPVRLADIEAAEVARLPVAAAEFARVLGGGIVPGSLVLIGGDPGVGKSTLLTQLAHDIASTSGPTLYVSGEESLAQSALRARRMSLHADNLLFLSETDVETILATVREVAARLVIVDSIQSVTTAEVEALPGSVSQLRESAQRFIRLAKSTGTSVILVGHVTKDGAIAGPKVLEHMVDTVLYLEGERFNQYRLLRSTKNRFGPTHEVGVFEMRDHGLAEVANPSSVFLAERDEASPGSVVTVTMEGTRALLVEVQALASRTSLAIPRRTANGFDNNRLHLIGAVLARRLGIPLHDQDIYLNVAGGMRIDEPAVDLAAALAIVSSVRDHAMPINTVAVGEVGLSGELRSVGYLEQRLRAASQLGFIRAVVPRSAGPPRELGGIALMPAATLREAVRSLQL